MSELKTVVLWKDFNFFQDSLINIFCNIIKVFNVTFVNNKSLMISQRKEIIIVNLLHSASSEPSAQSTSPSHIGFSLLMHWLSLHL